MLGNMEKSEEIDTSKKVDNEVTPKASQQADSKIDYTSKATKKTSFSDYWVALLDPSNRAAY